MLTRISDSLGANRIVLALSVARLGDAVGNSILFIIIPLYVAKLPAPWFPLPETVLVGLLISLYGLVNSILQPLMGAITDRISRRKSIIQLGLLLMGAGTLAFVVATRFTDLLLIRALQGIGVALTIPARVLVGMLTDKYGPRIVYSGLLLVSSIPCFMFAMADSYAQLALARFLLGFIGAGFVIGIRMVSEWFPANELGTAEGIYGGWGNFGSAAAALSRGWSWRCWP